MFHQVPTDCPQRDERRGWSGDASLTSEEASINFGMGAFYTAYLNQIQDDQQSDGAVTNFVPSLGTGDGAPNWQSVYPSIVYAMTMYFGDVQPVHDHLDSLRAYYKYLETSYNTTGMKQFRSGFGDWVRRSHFSELETFLYISPHRIQDVKSSHRFTHFNNIYFSNTGSTSSRTESGRTLLRCLCIS